jgi:serine/threonine protein kinase
VGAYEDANNIFIVQELLTGGDLQGLLDAQGTLSEADTAAAMRGVLTALAACHAADVCYGDVKPANFMLASMWPSIVHVLDPSKPKGEMALRAVDFGCAQFCPDGCSLVQGLSGTPGEACCAAACWFVAIVCYCMLARSKRPDGRSLVQGLSGTPGG